jgi:hypothetical protein
MLPRIVIETHVHIIYENRQLVNKALEFRSAPIGREGQRRRFFWMLLRFLRPSGQDIGPCIEICLIQVSQIWSLQM